MYTGFRYQQINSDFIEIYKIPVQRSTKIIKFHERLPQKTTLGDNWSAEIIDRLPVFLHIFIFCQFLYSKKGNSKLNFWIMANTSRLLLMFVLIFAFSEVHGNCWQTWSRCSGWSSLATGHLWLSCNNCCQCMGKSGGSCVEVASTCWMSSTAYQCQCHGTRVGDSPSFCDGLANSAFSCDTA